jgi:hypothetical protein
MFGTRDAESTKVSNRYETVAVVKKMGLPIDTVYYAASHVGSSLKSYIYYLPLFDKDLYVEDRSEWTKKEFDKHYDRLKGQALRYIERYAAELVAEKDGGITLKEAARYYTELSDRYRVLKSIKKYKKYLFIGDGEADESELFATITSMISQNQLHIEPGNENYAAEIESMAESVAGEGVTTEQQFKSLQTKFKNRVYRMVEMLGRVHAEMDLLGESIERARDERDRSLELDDVDLTATREYIVKLVEALKIVEAMREVSARHLKK